MNQVQGVLVVCPCYGAMSLQTVQTLLDLKAEGAQILLTAALADVSLSRCIAAAAAEQICRSKNSDIDFVFWLDSDVWGNAASVRALGQAILDFERASQATPTMSGLYLSRHRTERQQVAAHKLAFVDPVPMPGADPNALLMPALCGMGALMQTVDTFLKHCDESERMYWPDRTHTIPIVCASGAMKADRLAKYIAVNPDPAVSFWQGEDFDYCAREIDQGRPVFVAPIMFGHTAKRELTPVGDVTFPGFVPPAADGADADVAPGTSP